MEGDAPAAYAALLPQSAVGTDWRAAHDESSTTAARHAGAAAAAAAHETNGSLSTSGRGGRRPRSTAKRRAESAPHTGHRREHVLRSLMTAMMTSGAHQPQPQPQPPSQQNESAISLAVVQQRAKQVVRACVCARARVSDGCAMLTHDPCSSNNSFSSSETARCRPPLSSRRPCRRHHRRRTYRRYVGWRALPAARRRRC